MSQEEFNIPKIKSGFRAPENYFENFSAKMVQEIELSKKPTTKVISLQKHFYWLAACIAFIIITPFAYQYYKNTKQNTEIENYITEQSTISQDDLVELLNDNDINQLKKELQPDKEVVNEYLENTNVEQILLD
ncbi:hypothetical protein [Flavobacterium croceum]|uniref:Uncharacterized protein n=1 Tax=Flavobacterium croceum DSM 17960 TaxID=1121886 RepID=A0A2S4N7C4_9FLAO|nr:hypothetical protein [Flavobacterium croceum]POS01614.1 hypothetical protein Q361_10974 [Flavobacterium croceum DSM 17960]